VPNPVIIKSLKNQLIFTKNKKQIRTMAKKITRRQFNAIRKRKKNPNN